MAFFLLGALGVTLTVAMTARRTDRTEAAGQTAPAPFTVWPIGHVQKRGGRTLIVLDKKYQPGLHGLDGFSHAYIFWWFHRNDTPQGRTVLQVHPRGNPSNPLTGVFATRSPRRPNLIAQSLCKIVEVKENVVRVDQIDAFDGTPVVDIKPFIPGYDLAPEARVPGWLARRPNLRKRRAGPGGRKR